jgi:protein TonB
MAAGTLRRTLTRTLHHVAVVAGALGITLLLFMVLPLMQAITAPPAMDTLVRSADTASLEPPPPVEEPEVEPEKSEEPPPPELASEAQPLDLSQLELVGLGVGDGSGWGTPDFTVKIDMALQSSEQLDELVSIEDLDQRPRAVHQPSPSIDAEVRKAGGGTVYILFVVGSDGRVENPIVQRQVHPVLDRAALTAVRQWRFEPGRRNGQPVSFRMRVPITFPQPR